MSHAVRPGVCASAFVLAAAAAAMAQHPRIVGTMQLPRSHTLTGTLHLDIDGDGRGDLVLACRDNDNKRRELRIHQGRDAANGAPVFASEPSRPPLPIDRDVVAFTFVDCRPEPGRELVLLTAERAVVVDLRVEGGPSYTPLCEQRLVWPAADAQFVLPLADARCDFDGDGHDDLLLPVPDGAVLQLLSTPARRLAFQLPPRRRPAGSSKPGGASLQDGRLRLALTGDADAERDRPLVQLRSRTPAARLQDLEGDGSLELLAVRNDMLFIGRLRDGALQVEARPLPLPGDRLALFDPAFDVQLVDVDGDRRLDLVLTTSARRDDEVEVRIDLFRTAADGSWPVQPDSRLRLQALAQPPQLVDADGDGRLDVVAVTVRTDALRDPTSTVPTALEAQLHVFRGDGARFVLPAALGERLRLPVRSGRTALAQLLPGSADAPGALLLAVDDALVLRPLQRADERLRLAPATGRLPIPADARLTLADGSADVLVRTDTELLVVRPR